ncbi:MAG: DUF1501 domain-containing protein, partial [Planctomycetota bacterium]
PKINAALGRDHYPNAFSAAIFGGGVKQGFVLGSTDKRGEAVASDEASVQDFNATIGRALGLPLDKIVHSPEKRPFKFADKGKPLTSVFS